MTGRSRGQKIEIMYLRGSLCPTLTGFEYIKRFPWVNRGIEALFDLGTECIGVLTDSLEGGCCCDDSGGGGCVENVLKSTVECGSSLTIKLIFAAGAKSSVSRLLL